MISIDKLSNKLEIVLAGAETSNPLVWSVSFADDDARGSLYGETSGTTPVTMCTGIQGAPSPSVFGVRNVDFISVKNNDTVAAVVTIRIDDGTDTELVTVSLDSGYQLYYTSARGFFTLDENGREQTQITTISSLPSLTDGKIWVGDGSNVAQQQTPSGDVSMSNAGAFTLLASINKAITGIWSFVSEKLRIANGSFYTTLATDATANRKWTIPEEGGDKVFASRTYAESLVTGLWDDRGTFDASGGAYPSAGGSGTAGAILKGDIWTIGVAGTLPTGQVVEIGDTVRALVDSATNTQADWAIAQQNIGYVAENTANKDTDGTLSANSDTKYASQKATKTYADSKVADAITNGVTSSASSQNAVYDAIYAEENRWKTITAGNAFHVAATVTASDVYWHQLLGQTSIRQATGSSNPPSFVYLKASDYVSAIGLTPKLRIKVSLMAVNDVAPARTLTVGLYPCSGPTSGTTGAINTRVYNAGTVVTGSNGISFASPAADSMTFDQYSSVFDFPSEGLYSIASSISGALTSNSGVHIMAELQVHFE